MRRFKSVASAVLLVGLALMSTGCFRSKVVPSGTAVLVRKAGGDIELSTSGTYTAYGRDKTYFADTKIKSLSVDISVLCKDSINMDLKIKWVGTLKVTEETKAQLLSTLPVTSAGMGKEQLNLDKFWQVAMADIVIANAKDVVSPYKTGEILPNRDKIKADIETRVVNAFVDIGYPIKTSKVLVVNMDYPPEITASRKAIKKAELLDLENAAKAVATLAQKARDIEIAEIANKAKIVDAKGDATANEIRSSSLTPAVLQIKMQEALLALAKGPNNNTVIIPYDAIRADGSLVDTTLMRDAMAKYY